MKTENTKYKDSGIPWIGEIPSDWDYLKFKYAGNFEKGKLPLTTNIESVGSPIIGASEMNGKTPTTYTEQQDIPQCTNSDILILWDGANAGLIANHLQGVVSSTAVKYACQDHRCDDEYIYYQYKTFERYFKSKVSGTTIPHMNMKFINDCPLLLPPLPTQQRIADFLDRKCAEIDELSALQETMIAELKRYKQSVITEAVTKGLDKNVKMKASGVEWIGEIPEGWEMCRLKNILKRPLQYGANESGIPYNEELPRYVRITDILENSLREDLIKQSLSEEQAKGYILEDNDILFARSGGTVGKAFIYKQKYGRCAFAGYLIKAAIKKGVAQFIYYFTQSHCYEEWKRRIFIQATIQNIGADRYSIMELPLPPLSEQQAIAEYLDEKCGEIDELIAIKQQKIEQLKEYKKSVIYEYVTGKKEVKE